MAAVKFGRILSIALCSLLNYSLATSSELCKIQDACSCKYDNGSVIDLNSIAWKNTGPQWTKNATNRLDKSVYFYNPCYEFRIGSGEACSKGVRICQKQNESYFALGDFPNNFIYNKSIQHMQIIYVKDERTTIVTLVCSDSITNLTVVGETDPGKSENYMMTLTTKCACLDGCLQTIDNGLSTGSVLIILLFVFSFIYFIGGMMYLKFIRGASGYEMIPNYEFWLDFPLLVRDGVVFVLSGCRAETTYERI